MAADAFLLDGEVAGEVAVYDRALSPALSGYEGDPRTSLPPGRSTWCLTCWN